MFEIDSCKTSIVLYCTLRDNYSSGGLRISISVAHGLQNFRFQNFHFLSLKTMVNKVELWVILLCKIWTKVDVILMRRRIKNKHGANFKGEKKVVLKLWPDYSFYQDCAICYTNAEWPTVLAPKNLLSCLSPDMGENMT